MKNLNGFFDDAITSAEATNNSKEESPESTAFKPTLVEIEKEIKENHDWLESRNENQIVIDPLTVEHKTTDFDTMITQLTPAYLVLGWGFINDARDELNLHLNVDPKMGPGMREHGAINLRVTKLKKRAEGGATHKCEYRGKAVTRPSFRDSGSRLMLSLNTFEDLDGFSFDLSPGLIANYIYKAHGKTWLRLHAKRNGNLISIYC